MSDKRSKNIMETIFKLVNMAIIPAWILIAFFPQKEFTNKLVFSYAWHIVLAVLYTVFIVWGLLENTTPGGGMGTLEALRIGFENDKILVAAWLHYLVFDLFVGTWIAKDALEKNINSWYLKPILLFTLMAGPVGFLLYKVYLFQKK